MRIYLGVFHEPRIYKRVDHGGTQTADVHGVPGSKVDKFSLS